MIERYILRCNFGKNVNKFLYKCLANDGGPVWATGVDNAMEFEIKEFAELFCLDKNISSYDIITILRTKN